MAIRDRRKMKWQFAFEAPELIKAQRGLWRDTERIAKPIIDEYEVEEFDLRIAYAMEHNLKIRIMVWKDGFMENLMGHVHYVDPITNQIRIEVKLGEFNRVAFQDIVQVIVID
ncbi:YolD-like family protein [Bacillus sp. BRMEA1]|uniref:YolD-like family protein n=1 Tax=Neobacillus endophyticus TaxID=2738405 RepID=UPI0015672B4B|nr:YolD-like family protein [Neobacillus endophyticus]NRD78469.1 YolD-like family protein [Neobacillus endophyticus]